MMPKKKMIALEPTDYLFLAGETRQQPMHVGCLLFYCVKEGEDANEAATSAFARMQSYTQANPPFNYRLARRWLPYWEEDHEFDITNHVRHVQLPHPGDIKELLKLVGVFHGLTMDRSLPLWYVWIISGLPDNRYAVYTQIHHSLLDGVSGARMIARAHSPDPAQRAMPPIWALPVKGSKRKASNQAKAQGDLETDPFSAAVNLLRSNRNIARTVMQAWKNDRIGLFGSDMFNAPDTILNQRITGARRFVADSFSLSRIKAVGKPLGATVNDMLLTMMGRSLQRYLEDLGQLPKEPLRVLMPVNLREDDSVGGNQIAMVRASLGTDQTDIAGIMAAVKRSVDEQKKLLRKLSKGESQLYSGITLAPWLANATTGKLDRFRTANTLLSNVPGPKETLYWNGEQLDAMYPVSIVMHQTGVNFTVFSYRDNIELGIIGCRNRIPHLQVLLQYMHEALDEMEAASRPAKKQRSAG